MKCFFGSSQIKDEIKGMKFEEFLLQVISEAYFLGLKPIMTHFGKVAWKLSLTN